MLKKIFKLSFTLALTGLVLFSTNLSAFAETKSPMNDKKSSTNSQKSLLPSISFNLNDLKTHSKTITLPDGTKASVSAEPVFSTRGIGLNGTWRISGKNALASMEYYVDLVPVSSGSNYTKINSAYGLAVAGALTSYSDDKINRVRDVETSTRDAIVEGYARFNYLGNQWISIWTQSGGVRTTVSYGNIYVELY